MARSQEFTEAVLQGRIPDELKPTPPVTVENPYDFVRPFYEKYLEQSEYFHPKINEFYRKIKT